MGIRTVSLVLVKPFIPTVFIAVSMGLGAAMSPVLPLLSPLPHQLLLLPHLLQQSVRVSAQVQPEAPGSQSGFGLLQLDAACGMPGRALGLQPGPTKLVSSPYPNVLAVASLLQGKAQGLRGRLEVARAGNLPHQLHKAPAWTGMHQHVATAVTAELSRSAFAHPLSRLIAVSICCQSTSTRHPR